MADEQRQDDEFVPEALDEDWAEQGDEYVASAAAGTGDVLSALRRHWLLVAAVCAAAVAMGGLYTYTVARTYVATAELKIDRFLPRMANMPGVERYGNQPYDYVLTQCQVIQSPRIISAALSDPTLGGTPVLAGQTDPTRYVRERLRVQPKDTTQVVELRLAWPDATEGADLLNAIIDAYMKYNLSRKQDTASDYVRSLQQHREELKKELTGARRRVQTLMAKSGVVPTPGGGQDVAVAKLSDISRALTKAQIARLREESRLQSLRAYSREQWRDLAGAQTGAAQELSSVRAQLLGKRQEMAEIEERLGSAHPQIRALRQQVQVLAQAEDQALLRIARSVMAQAVESHTAAKSREQALRTAFDKQQQLLFDQAGKMSQYATLRNDEERTRNVYQRVVQRIKELAVVGNEGVCNISVLSPASAPLEAAGPDKPRVLSVAALIGLGLGLALVMVVSRPTTPGYATYRSPVGPIASPA